VQSGVIGVSRKKSEQKSSWKKYQATLILIVQMMMAE
jgi:hypothetical protein